MPTRIVCQVVYLMPLCDALQLRQQLDEWSSRGAAWEASSAAHSVIVTGLKSELQRKSALLQTAKLEVAQLTAVKEALEQRSQRSDCLVASAAGSNACWHAVAKGVQDLCRVVLRSVAATHAGAIQLLSFVAWHAVFAAISQHSHCTQFACQLQGKIIGGHAGGSALLKAQRAGEATSGDTQHELPLAHDQIAELVGLSAVEVSLKQFRLNIGFVSV
jgi:hypothetical protein